MLNINIGPFQANLDLNDIKRHALIPNCIDLARPVLEWRDWADEGLDAVGRRICAGIALVGISIASLIESVAKLGLAAIATFALFHGEGDLSLCFLRGALASLVTAGLLITAGEVFNVIEDRADKTTGALFKEVLGPIIRHPVLGR